MSRPIRRVFPVDPLVAAARERLLSAFASASWDPAEFGAARLQLDTILQTKQPRDGRDPSQLVTNE